MAVIGGGIMGKYTTDATVANHTGMDVRIWETDKLKRAELQRAGYRVINDPTQELGGMDSIMYCTPVDVIGQSLEQTLPYVRGDVQIFDQLSRKLPFASEFERVRGEIEGGLERAVVTPIHTMANPTAKTSQESINIALNQRLAIMAYQANPDQLENVVDFFSGYSRRIHLFDGVFEHDERTANTQVNTSRLLLSIASAYAETGKYVWQNTNAIDRIKFALAMRLMKPAAHVYRNIQFGNDIGNKITKNASRVEQELFQLIVEGDKMGYRKRVMDARNFLFPNLDEPPIFTDDDIKKLTGDMNMINDHFSLVQYMVERAESGKSLVDDYKAGTPNFDLLLCLVDRLCKDEKLFNQALDIPFDPNLTAFVDEDRIFHDQINGWSRAQISQNEQMFNAMHANVKAKIPQETIDEQFELSKEFVSLATERTIERFGL